MAYAAWSVVFSEQPSAAKWNILGTNDAYFNGHLPAGYNIPVMGRGGTVDATTYYIGLSPILLQIAQTTAAIQRVYIPKEGTVTNIYGYAYNDSGTGPTTEQSTISFRLNNTTDTTITSTFVTPVATAVTAFSNAALSITVAKGDYFEIKWVTPAWATNPSNGSSFVANVYIEI